MECKQTLFSKEWSEESCIMAVQQAAAQGCTLAAARLGGATCVPLHILLLHRRALLVAALAAESLAMHLSLHKQRLVGPLRAALAIPAAGSTHAVGGGSEEPQQPCDQNCSQFTAERARLLAHQRRRTTLAPSSLRRREW